MSNWIRSLGIALFFVAQAEAQITATVGPANAPVGCDIVVTIANDTPSAILIGDGCPYTVRDANGAVVYSGPCPIFVPFNVPPGAVQTVIPWDQRDQSGNQVPIGIYTVTVNLPFGQTSTHTIAIGSAAVGIAQLGVLRPGTIRSLRICSPQDPGRVFLGAAAFSATSGINTCAGTFPLDNDPLLAYSTLPNPNFIGFVGTLDGAGGTTAPTIAVPPLASLSGATFFIACAVLDPTNPCPLLRFSPAESLSIL